MPRLEEDRSREPLVIVEEEGDVARLRLNRPSRTNALVPELLEEFIAGVRQACAERPRCLVLSATGRAFSTGGDIAGFLERAGNLEALLAYSGRLVGLLNDAILELLAFPNPVVAVVSGPVTGGSLGFLLAADLVLMSEDAFLQPYYVDMGFAPDGGWTAMLPERIGARRALEIQLLNQRIDAQQAAALGLASSVVPAGELEAKLQEHLAVLRKKERESLRAARALIWDESRRMEVERRLSAEKSSFLKLVARHEVIERMRAFMEQR
ncbi:enoyl-CoA hydratase/isomerase family protein [Rhizobium puerariae]|uniref:Enoyl-CoA hydratase/isomerase family protein n=1 Tax=Rhizobium puerariae TaxID=1585791 RepID=A0ABV6AMU2_9HYPH